MEYYSKFTGLEVDELLQKVKDGDVGGSVTIDTELSETSMNPLANATVTAELKKKVNAVEGKGLSSNDFTDEAKEKLDGLENYDDSALKADIAMKVSNTDLATINGQRIDKGGNIEIEASEGTLTAEEVSSTEPTAEFPQVLYTSQELTEEQKSQARENIGVSKAIEEAIAEIPAPESSAFEAVYGVTTFAEIVEAYNAGKLVTCRHAQTIAQLISITDSSIYFTSIDIKRETRFICFSSNLWSCGNHNTAHELSTLDNGDVQVTIAGKSAEVATPAYVSDAIASAITNVLNEEV